MSAREARVGLMAYLGEASWDENLRLPELRARLNRYRDALIVEARRECAKDIRTLIAAQVTRDNDNYWAGMDDAADLIDPDKEN